MSSPHRLQTTDTVSIAINRCATETESHPSERQGSADADCSNEGAGV